MDKKIAAILLLVLVLGFALRINPLLNGTLGGPDPYFHARLSEQAIAEEGVPVFDELSQQGRHYSYAPLFHLMYASLSLLSGLPVIFLVNFLPALYGALGVLLVFVFARKFFDNKAAVLAAFSLAVMNLHILRTASYSRPDGLSLLLIPAVLFFFHQKKFKTSLLLSVAQVLLHPLSSIFSLSFILLPALAGRYLKRDYGFEFRPALAIVLVTVLVWLAWLYGLPYGWEQYVSKISMESAEMGSVSFVGFLGFFTFSWLFLLAALVKQKQDFFVKYWFVLALAMGMFASRLAIHLTLPVALLSGSGLALLMGKTKPYTKVFLVLVAVLAVISIAGLLHPGPSPYISGGEKTALSWLKENSLESASISAPWDFGHPIAYLAQRRTVIDGYFEFAQDLDERNDNWKRLATTSDCARIEELAAEFETDYFIVPRKRLNELSFENGIMEANDCPRVSAVYHGSHAKVFEYN